MSQDPATRRLAAGKVITAIALLIGGSALYNDFLLHNPVRSPVFCLVAAALVSLGVYELIALLARRWRIPKHADAVVALTIMGIALLVLFLMPPAKPYCCPPRSATPPPPASPSPPLHTPTTTPTVTPTPSATPSPTVPATPTQTPTPTPDYYPNGYCDDVEEPCIAMPKSGESLDHLAARTSYGEACRWPEIANLNRAEDGTYRELKGILLTAGVFVPKPAAPDYYDPRIVTYTGPTTSMKACVVGASIGQLPCMYRITEGDGITGLNYMRLALLFYGALERDGIDLVQYIKLVNRGPDRSGTYCVVSTRRLFDGVKVVIPVRP